jgi:hypothetical protein
MLKTLRSEISDLGWIIRTLTLAAVVAALYRELRLPAKERTWHGSLLGFVPYDFRPPSPSRLVKAYWNPGSSQVVGPQPFGVGWALNLPAAAALLDRVASRFGGRRTTASRTKG